MYEQNASLTTSQSAGNARGDSQYEAVLNDVATRWLSEILKLGLASVTKTTLEAALVNSFDQVFRIKGLERLSDYQLGLKLKVSTQKVKALRYQADLLFCKSHEAEAKLQFLRYLSRASPESINDKVRLQLTSKLARTWVQDWVELSGCEHDTSFNRDIVELRIETLRDLLKSIECDIVLDPEARRMLENHMTMLDAASTVEIMRTFVTALRAIPFIGRVV